jgi:transposase InsO family protein
MRGRGKSYDNAVMESLFHTLKTELVVHYRWQTRQAAQLAIFVYGGLLQSLAAALKLGLSRPCSVRGCRITQQCRMSTIMG